MFETGRMCVKLAGRDAGLKCVVVDELDDGYVLIDGQTRRRKCNVKHLEPLSKTIDIKKGASHSEVKKAFQELDIKVRDTKPKKKAEPRPKKSKVVKSEQPDEEKESPESKEEPSEEKEELPSRSTVESMTKDEIKEYAQEEFGVELSTNDLKKEMIDQLFEKIK